MSEELLNKAQDTSVTGVDSALTGGGNYGGSVYDAAANGTTGLLTPEQEDKFIDYMWDATTLAKEGRRIRMRATQVDIDKIGVGTRVVRSATEADGAYTNAGVTFSKVTVTTQKLRLDWETSTELVEDGIDTSVDDHIARLFATQVGNDLEDLAINGDGTTAPFLDILPDGGFAFQALAGAGHFHDFGGDDAGATDATYVSRDVFDVALKKLPRKYKANRGAFRFYAGSGLVQDYLNTFTNVVNSPESLAESVIRGAISGPIGPGGQQYPLAYGVPIVEVPLFDEPTAPTATDAAAQKVSDLDVIGHVELTNPGNRIWGVKREIEFYSEFKPKKDTTEHTAYLRFGIQVENWDQYVAVGGVRVKGY